MRDLKYLAEICNDILYDHNLCQPQAEALKEIIAAIKSGELCTHEEYGERGEYKVIRGYEPIAVKTEPPITAPNGSRLWPIKINVVYLGKKETDK